MSDGISEGYRAARAHDEFEEAWEMAKVDHLLLDIKSSIDHMSVEDLTNTLTDLCHKLSVTTESKYEIREGSQVWYQEGVSAGYIKEHNCPLIKFYTVGVSCKTYRSFKSRSLIDSLRQALLFVEWTKTEEGQRAIDVCDNY